MSEWGPWIEHDGKGCPCVGEWVRVVAEGLPGQFIEGEGRAGNEGTSWDWRYWHLWDAASRAYLGRIVRYRIRKPRALQQLIELVENLPAPVRESEDA